VSFKTLVLRGGIEYADVELGDENLSGSTARCVMSWWADSNFSRERGCIPQGRRVPQPNEKMDGAWRLC
jgi:hypothetical protein